ncbi:sulfurtransferase [uncultured Lutibacter sp.]|uniref:sulfurtransferase n=1 Tax=uncultured Lutibacter sp. TaxID=437739 RepID=UPI00260A266D|nr:sulfurtransferase [uncultured Lutibacter sp.]
MSNTISPIIEVKELIEIHQLETLVIVDASNETSYKAKHLDGALFVNLNTQLSNIKEDVSIGGRHPLTTIKQFSQTLKSLGINEKSHVVIYDDKNGANSAARFWWMLRAIGHDKVQVLNGGIQEAERKGFLINSELVEAKKTASYNFANYKLPQADISEVENYSQDKNYIVVDVREEERYLGIKEPLDLVAGHIPGAINIPFSTNLDPNGLFKTSKELNKKYQVVFENIKSDHIIVHCGSGVTACHTLLAIAYAGLDIPKLYVGSWSEWSRNNKNIATINTNF